MFLIICIVFFFVHVCFFSPEKKNPAFNLGCKWSLIIICTHCCVFSGPLLTFSFMADKRTILYILTIWCPWACTHQSLCHIIIFWAYCFSHSKHYLFLGIELTFLCCYQHWDGSPMLACYFLAVLKDVDNEFPILSAQKAMDGLISSCRDLTWHCCKYAESQRSLFFIYLWIPVIAASCRISVFL